MYGLCMGLTSKGLVINNGKGVGWATKREMG